MTKLKTTAIFSESKKLHPLKMGDIPFCIFLKILMSLKDIY